MFVKGKHIWFTEANKAEIVAVDLYPLKENEVICKTIYSAISQGTEKANFKGLQNTYGAFPKKPGYCAVSIVVEVGANVKAFRPGDKVLVYHGYHGDYVKVSENVLTKVEDQSIDDKELVFVILAAMGLGGLRRLEMEVGESFAVFGLGMLGVTALQFAKLSGACPLIAVDFSEERRRMALELGADYALDPREEGFVEKVKEITNGGVNAIVEVTGSAQALQTSLDVVARGGRISLLGCTRVSDCNIDYYQKVHVPGVKLLGAHNVARPLVDSRPHCWTMKDDMKAIMKLLSYKKVTFLPLLTEIYSPYDCQSVYENITSGKQESIGLLFDWREM